jgi:hypothetical protein
MMNDDPKALQLAIDSLTASSRAHEDSRSKPSSQDEAPSNELETGDATTSMPRDSVGKQTAIHPRADTSTQSMALSMRPSREQSMQVAGPLIAHAGPPGPMGPYGGDVGFNQLVPPSRPASTLPSGRQSIAPYSMMHNNYMAPPHFPPLQPMNPPAGYMPPPANPMMAPARPGSTVPYRPPHIQSGFRPIAPEYQPVVGMANQDGSMQSGYPFQLPRSSRSRLGSRRPSPLDSPTPRPSSSSRALVNRPSPGFRAAGLGFGNAISPGQPMDITVGGTFHVSDDDIAQYRGMFHEIWSMVRGWVRDHAGIVDHGIVLRIRDTPVFRHLISIYHPFSQEQAVTYIRIHLKEPYSRQCLIARAIIDYLSKRVFVLQSWATFSPDADRTLQQISRDLRVPGNYS